MDMQGATDLTEMDEPSPANSPQEMTAHEMAKEGHYLVKLVIDSMQSRLEDPHQVGRVLQRRHFVGTPAASSFFVASFRKVSITVSTLAWDVCALSTFHCACISECGQSPISEMFMQIAICNLFAHSFRLSGAC